MDSDDDFNALLADDEAFEDCIQVEAPQRKAVRSTSGAHSNQTPMQAPVQPELIKTRAPPELTSLSRHSKRSRVDLPAAARVGGHGSNLCARARAPSVKQPARRFPGPAGILPPLVSATQLSERKEDAEKVTAKWLSMQPNHQVPEAVNKLDPEPEGFDSGAWMTMISSMKGFTGYNGGAGTDINPKHTIATVLYGNTIGKVPLLCTTVKRFSLSESDASVTLMDPTGEMRGTLHRGIFDSYSADDLAPGAAIVLKQVAVFTPAPRRHYLNVTPNNILKLFPPNTPMPNQAQHVHECDTDSSAPNKENAAGNILSNDSLDPTGSNLKQLQPQNQEPLNQGPREDSALSTNRVCEEGLSEEPKIQKVVSRINENKSHQEPGVPKSTQATDCQDDLDELLEGLDEDSFFDDED